MKKNKLYVVGNPIEHSKSPLIHNFWIKKYSLNASYHKLKVLESELPDLVNDLRTDKIHGFNVTIPFKKVMLSLVDEIEPSAARSKAINTVYKSGDQIIGTNTDGAGFVSSLKNDLNYMINNKSNIVCVGAGGAAYGIISSLLEFKLKSVEIINRTRPSGIDLIKHFSKCNGGDKIFNLRPWNYSLNKSIDLLINSSACGMKKGDKFGIDLSLMSKEALVYDIIYNPRKTALMKLAESNKLRTTNGIFMLIRQAAESFNKWFGIMPSNSDVNKALETLGKDF